MTQAILGIIVTTVVCLALVTVTFKQPWLLLGLLGLVALVYLRVTGATRHTVLFFLIWGTVGFVFEVICIAFGVWRYATPQVLGAPVWLPVLWGIAAVLIARAQSVFAQALKLQP